jgi:hypothetical protein
MTRRPLVAALAVGLAGGTIFALGTAVAADADVSKRHVIVYDEPGRFAGWPANNGVWIWGDEILVGFARAYYRASEDDHSFDRDKASKSVLGRSLDGGETWSLEDPEGFVGDGAEAAPSPGGIDFAHPDFAMRVGGDEFFVSYDRGKTWKGPYALPDFGGKRLSARTDYLVNDRDDCLLFLSAKEPRVQAGIQDRAFAARTRDGGKTFEFLGWMTGEPITIRSVMPSTARLSPTHLVSALRRRLDVPLSGPHKIQKMWIDVYESQDDGTTWEFLSQVADTGAHNGNPPSLLRLRDGRIVVTYGYRSAPEGIRAKVSADGGKTWGPEIHLRDDGRTWDLGYTRSVQRKDGKIVTVYYYTTAERPEQHIAATIWDPGPAE